MKKDYGQVLPLDKIFLPAVWLFRLPAIALCGGITLISLFIIRTNNKIAKEKAEAQARASKKVA